MDSFLVGEDLKNALTILPPYNDNIRSAPKAERLLALNNIFDVYYPSVMATEIYSKLYLAYIRARQKKNTLTAIRQGYENRKVAKGQFYKGIIGGCDSFTIIGASGIGKSTAISRAISLISKSIPEENNTQSIPFLAVQTPGDSSLKGLLMEILRTVDVMLNTKYYQDAIRSRATVDMLIGLVSQVCLNHLCVLIIDEAQNLVSAKNGQTLVNTLVQLINNSGISLCFVGTPECSTFFESAFQLARRSVGLRYSALAYDDYFCALCKVLYSYQYTARASAITEDIISWLYLHSGGITAIVVGLIHAAQEIAILDGVETLSLEMFRQAYTRRMAMLYEYTSEQGTPVKTFVQHLDTRDLTQADAAYSESLSITDIVAKAKRKNQDIIEVLKQHCTIEEICL